MKAQTRFTFIGLIVLIALVTSIALPITALADGAPTPPPASGSSDSSQPAPASDSSAQPAQAAPASNTSSQPAQAAPASDTSSQPAQAAPASDTSSQPAQSAPASDSSAQPSQAAPASDTSSQPSQAAPASNTSAPAQPADTSAPANPPAATDASAPTQGTDASAATQAPSAAVASDTPVPADTTNAANASTGSDSHSVTATVTPVVVINSTGTVEPLATQAAAEIIAHGDPMWCPSGVAPGGSGCTFSHYAFNSYGGDPGLLSELSGKTSAGTIWIEYNYDSTNESGTPVTLDGSSLGSTANYALTLQGGWDGNLGSMTITATPSIFGIPLTITNWTGDVTINDLIITGTASNGLTVTTTGNISVNNVKSNHNNDNGALLDNTSGSGNIYVSNSVFGDLSGTNGNGSNGLKAYSTGNVTLTNVTADGNTNGGAYLDNKSGSGSIIQVNSD